MGAIFALARTAAADPLRLRSDALLQSQAPAPVGLVALRGEDRLRPWLDVETSVWMGASRDPSVVGDVLTLSANMRDAQSGSQLRLGRMLVAAGAIRPLHLDGVRGVARGFGGTSAEAFAGAPVVRRFDYKTFDFAAGGRLAQSFSDVAVVGGSYLQRRTSGQTSDEEVGLDAAFSPRRYLTAAIRWAFDLNSRGTSEALASLSTQSRDAKAEVFLTHRSPGRMLPSTSLFSVLGDIPATALGASGRLRMFPRLELSASANGQFQGETVGGQGYARVTLALDDVFDNVVAGELRRVDFGASQWTGFRVLASKSISRLFRLATELEVVVPDRPRERGAVWPWGLVALALKPSPRWDLALGTEASSGPQYRGELNVLLRGTYMFEVAAR